jgi:hypothetical protein
MIASRLLPKSAKSDGDSIIHIKRTNEARTLISGPRDVNNQSGLIGLIDSNQSAHSIKPISRFFCINQANLRIFVDLLLS